MYSSYTPSTLYVHLGYIHIHPLRTPKTPHMPLHITRMYHIPPYRPPACPIWALYTLSMYYIYHLYSIRTLYVPLHTPVHPIYSTYTPKSPHRPLHSPR